MALLDGPFRSLANTLLSVMGAAATLERTTPGTFDPLQNEDILPTEATESVKISPPERFKIESLNRLPIGGEFASTLRGQVQQGDFWCLLAASATTIGVVENQTYRLQVAGDWFKVISYEPIYSGDLVAAYFLHLRR